MASAKTHEVVGVFVGLLVTAYSTPGNQQLSEAALRVLGGVLGGIVGAKAPDTLEPALSSRHRSMFHSWSIAATALVSHSQIGSTLQNREETITRLKVMRASAKDHDRQRLSAEIAMQQFIAGFLPAFIAAYCSHLVLDAGTPRGLPLIA
jgi:membrane-bound metal-dependent hydrolase YbcI (DUF457 family)